MTKPRKRKTNGKTKPFFVPTEQHRKTVEAMSAYGIPGAEIARVIGIGYTTLHKYFRDEMDNAHVRANAAVAETAFKMATSGKVPAATFFWLKTRAGWREVQRMEHSGAIGSYDLSKVSDADLNKLEAILGPIAAASANPGGDS